jgi:hypothetical protein
MLMTKWPHSAAPRLAAYLLLPRVHAPHDPAHIAGAAVDLVEHAPLIGEIEEPVLGKRRRFEVLVCGSAADRNRVSDLERLHVPFVDLVERRITLRIIGAVIHQPVLPLPVGIDESLRSDLGGKRR